MLLQFLRTIALCAPMTLLGMTSVQAQWVTNLPDNIELKPKQVFRIHTKGPPAPKAGGEESTSTRSPKLISEYGTGFAIAPNAIITARHVTLNADKFRSKSDKISIPERTVKVFYTETEERDAEEKDNFRLWVTPASNPTIDASLVNLDTLNVTPFNLSVCDIGAGKEYHLLKFSNDEKGEESKVLQLPISIVIKASVDRTARLGDLRLFTHEAELKSETPRAGDSGSPVLDSQGNVVGLLSAIEGDNNLYVTPVSSFVDLLPQEMKTNTKCPENLEVTIGNLNSVEKRIDFELLELRKAITDQEKIVRKLESQVFLLENVNERLAQLVSDQGTFIATTSDRANSVLAAMLVDRTNRGDMTGERLKSILNEMKEKGEIKEEVLEAALKNVDNARPVIPAVSRVIRDLEEVVEDLGEPIWGFKFVPSVETVDKLSFEVSYARDISRPAVSSELYFCVRPMLEFKDDVDRRQKRKNGEFYYKDVNFYFASDDEPRGRTYLPDCERAEQPAGNTKAFTYSFRMKKPEFVESDYPLMDLSLVEGNSSGRKYENWGGKYYGYVLRPYEAAVKDDDGNFERDENGNIRRETKYEMMHRFVLRVGADHRDTDTECFYFPKSAIVGGQKVNYDEGELADNLVEFAKDADEYPDLKELYKCPTL